MRQMGKTGKCNWDKILVIFGLSGPIGEEKIQQDETLLSHKRGGEVANAKSCLFKL